MLLKLSDTVSERLSRAEACGRHAKRPERTEVVSDQGKPCLR
jgi:hypothetical protein